MRFLPDAGRRPPVPAILLVFAVAATSLTGSPSSAQTTTPQRLPPTTVNGKTAGTRPTGPAVQGAAPATAAPPVTITPRVATGGSAAPPGKAQSGPAAAAAPAGPAAPFTLNTREEELLSKILARWEAKNTGTKTFKCKFQRWEYDDTIKDEEAKDHLRSKAIGEVKYKRPDHGMFQVGELAEFDGGTHKYEKRTDGLEHWVCDGANIYEFVPDLKKLKVHPLPKEMQGDAIADGPVPFIFGAKADKMKQRYWIRDTTPKEELGKHVWLQIFPKYQHDAMNFESANVMLNDADFTIYGLQIMQPGGTQWTTFIFDKVVINDRLELFKGDFAAPKTPSGWTKEVDPVDEAVEQAAPQLPAEATPPRQARLNPAGAPIKR
jgi:TIGR03009 family protein